MTNATRRAAWLAFAVSGALLGGALISQYGFGLYPCEMCHWQRWPHMAAMVLAALAIALRRESAGRTLVVLAALAIAISGAIGIYHAGVEYGWWEGLTTCSTVEGPVSFRDLMNAPLVRCDQALWTLFGVSLAGFNALFSLAGALAVLWTLRGSRHGSTVAA